VRSQAGEFFGSLTLAVLLLSVYSYNAHADIRVVQENGVIPHTKIDMKPVISEDDPVLLSSEQIDYENNGEVVIADGKVEISQGDTILLADQVIYDRSTGIVTAHGNISVLEPSGNVYFADDLELHDSMSQGVVKEFKTRLIDDSLLTSASAMGNIPAPQNLAAAPANETEAMAILLAKQAGLLPAMLVVACKEVPAAFAHWITLDMHPLKLWARSPLVDVLPIAKAKLPVHGAEDATLHSFRSRYGSSVHLALVIGDIKNNATPLVRVHSSCVTGDILGSLRCDCGDQLRLALGTICAESSGVLIYLHQEGRGIGIGNKLRAYHLQEQGMDTYDANLALGFEEDERDFSIAAAILKQLGIARIRLLTNNPGKITALKGSGIVIDGRVPVAAPPGKHNHDYLKAKAEKTGHLF
jgi:GTP cyclohydrolase II